MRKLISACALFAFLPLAGAEAGEGKLSAMQLRGLAPGSYQVAVMAVVSLSVHLYSNGRITGDTGNQHDTGQWHIVGDRLCITWNKWLSGQTKCSSFSDQNGALVGDGLTIRRS